MRNENIVKLRSYLEGPEGCNFREEKGEEIWDCDNTHRYTLEWCKDNGVSFELGAKGCKRWPIIDGVHLSACCDCEVVFNG